MMNSEARKRANPRIPADVLLERLRFVLQGAVLWNNAEAPLRTAGELTEALRIVDQLREAI